MDRMDSLVQGIECLLQDNVSGAMNLLNSLK